MGHVRAEKLAGYGSRDGAWVSWIWFLSGAVFPPRLFLHGGKRSAEGNATKTSGGKKKEEGNGEKEKRDRIDAAATRRNLYDGALNRSIKNDVGHEMRTRRRGARMNRAGARRGAWVLRGSEPQPRSEPERVER